MTLLIKDLSKRPIFIGQTLCIQSLPVTSQTTLLVDVTFGQIVQPEALAQDVTGLTSPFVVLWYIGTRGLKKDGVQFYKDRILDPIRAKNQNAKFALVDLTAWGALRDPNMSLQQASSHTEKLSETFITMNTSSVFTQIQDIICPVLIDHFKTVLEKNWIQRSSLDAKQAGFQAKVALKTGCPIIEGLLELDASQVYSALQYLEALILIEELVKKSENSIVDIVFALPNDELKYYQDEENSFQKDLQFFLENRSTTGYAGRDIRVHFRPFSYGEEISNRPYNAPGKVIKKGKLQTEDVMTTRSFDHG